MMSLEMLMKFFGWCSVINIGILAFAAIIIAYMRGPIAQMHGKMFGLDESDLSRAYFQYLGQYKIAIFVFNLIPYLALRLIG